MSVLEQQERLFDTSSVKDEGAAGTPPPDLAALLSGLTEELVDQKPEAIRVETSQMRQLTAECIKREWASMRIEMLNNEAHQPSYVTGIAY